MEAHAWSPHLRIYRSSKQCCPRESYPSFSTEIDASNTHLKPATLILSEMNTDPIGDWGLTFVTKSGKCVSLAATEQIVDPTKAWIGSKDFLARTRISGGKNPRLSCRISELDCMELDIMALVEPTPWRHVLTVITRKW